MKDYNKKMLDAVKVHLACVEVDMERFHTRDYAEIVEWLEEHDIHPPYTEEDMIALKLRWV